MAPDTSCVAGRVASTGEACERHKFSASRAGEWLLHDCCLAYTNVSEAPREASTAHWYYALHLFRTSSRQPDARLSPKSWPPLFVEAVGTRNFSFSKQGRKRFDKLARTVERWPREWHELAVVTAITFDNLWHSVFHSLPLSEYADRLSRADPTPGGATLWPWFVDAPAWSADVSKWVGWQLLARSLLAAAPSLLAPDAHWRAIAARTAALHRPGRVHCFRTLVGGHSRFFPRLSVQRRGLRYTWVTEELQRAAPRFATFRQRVLGGFGLPEVPTPPSTVEARILFVLRRHPQNRSATAVANLSRAVINEAALRASVAAHPTLRRIVAFCTFDALTLREQLRHISNASALVGVHGQARCGTPTRLRTAPPDHTPSLHSAPLRASSLRRR